MFQPLSQFLLSAIDRNWVYWVVFWMYYADEYCLGSFRRLAKKPIQCIRSYGVCYSFGIVFSYTVNWRLFWAMEQHLFMEFRGTLLGSRKVALVKKISMISAKLGPAPRVTRDQ